LADDSIISDLFISKHKSKVNREEKIYEDWLLKKREKVRKQAAYEAKLKYEKFKKTKTYKTAQAFNKGLNYVILLSGILIIAGAIYGLHYKGIYKTLNGKQVIDINGIFCILYGYDCRYYNCRLHIT